MTRYSVVMTAPRLAPSAVALLRAAGCAIHYTPPYPSPEALAELVRRVRADAILSRQGKVGADVMDASAALRVVARHGVGVDDVDLEAARARGLLVTRAPGSNTVAVAEHTLALILALAKNLRPFGAAIEAGGWRGGETQARDIAGLRLGLIGLGDIGRTVRPLAEAFGMAVAGCDEAAVAAGGLPALLGVSDVVSLHCPLTPRTRHLIDAAALAAMPAGSFLVNTARGGIVDEAALLAALDRGHLAGAALDVFEDEPPPAGHPLRRHPRVIATPHVAGVTPDALDRMGVMAAECIVAALTGQAVPPERVVVAAR